MEKKNLQFNFVLFLVIFIAFFALIWIGLEKITPKTKGNLDPFIVQGDDLRYREMFSFDDAGVPSVSSDPVLGVSTRWGRGAESLTVNDKHVIYRNNAVEFSEIEDSKVLQDKAIEKIESLGIVDVVINYEKNEVFKVEGDHLDDVEPGENGQVLKVVFDDVESGNDRVNVLLSGSGEILEVTIIKP